jgi:hypothetical protein
MNTSTNTVYQMFLVKIAQQVDSLLIENPAAIGRFRQHLQDFADKENKHLKWQNKKRGKCLKEGKPFSISSDMKVPSEYKSPACMFVIDCTTKNYPASKNEAEECQRNYITLSSIHDNILTQVERIDQSILPEMSAHLIWSTLHEIRNNSSQRAFIEQALKRVQADLTSLKAQEKAGQGKGKKITKDEANVRVGQLFKETPTWDWSTRKLAKQIHCGHVLISKTPVYIAYNEKRKELRRKKTINTVSLSNELEAVLGKGEKDEVLKQLIAEQKKEGREDARQARLYLSHEKKPDQSRR